MTYEESLLLKDIKAAERDLIALKTPQRYLMGQVKGYVSNEITVNSRILDSRSGYERRGILGWAKFVGDKPQKRVNAKMKFQLYNSSGSPIALADAQGGIALEALESSAGDSPNEMWFIMEFDVSGESGTTDAFYARFWVVANDSGILTYQSDIQGTT